MILLGAGASRGCFDQPIAPVAADFGRVFGNLHPDWQLTFSSLASVVQHLGLDPGTWPLEPVWSCIDYYAKLQAALPLAAPWKHGSQEIKKAVLSVYGRPCDEAAVAADSTLATLLRGAAPGDVVISFNYDTIAERLAARLGMKLISTPRGINESGIRFAKPHGSVSWTLNLKTGSLHWAQPNGVPLLRSLCDQDVDCGREPLVLGAVPIKSELIQQVQAHLGLASVFDAIAMQWRALVEAIRDANVVVVAGYSFPAEDQYGRFMISEGLRLRTAGVSVEVFDLDCNKARQAEVIAQTFRSKLRELVFHGPMKPSAA